jgi:hypothetical protein
MFLLSFVAPLISQEIESRLAAAAAKYQCADVEAAAQRRRQQHQILD